MKGVKRVSLGEGMRIGSVAWLGLYATMNEMRGVTSSQKTRGQLHSHLVARRSHNLPGNPPSQSSQHGAEQIHHRLHVAGCDHGRGWTDHLPGGDLRPVELLGLLHLQRLPDHLLQPNPLDLLVHVEPDCVRGGAQLDQARYPVTSASAAILSRGVGGLTNTNVELNPFQSRTWITQNSKTSFSSFDSEGFEKPQTTFPLGGDGEVVFSAPYPG